MWAQARCSSSVPLSHALHRPCHFLASIILAHPFGADHSSSFTCRESSTAGLHHEHGVAYCCGSSPSAKGLRMFAIFITCRPCCGPGAQGEWCWCSRACLLRGMPNLNPAVRLHRAFEWHRSLLQHSWPLGSSMRSDPGMDAGACVARMTGSGGQVTWMAMCAFPCCRVLLWGGVGACVHAARTAAGGGWRRQVCAKSRRVAGSAVGEADCGCRDAVFWLSCFSSLLLQKSEVTVVAPVRQSGSRHLQRCAVLVAPTPCIAGLRACVRACVRAHAVHTGLHK
ncbi:hypothetical protein COO60DRAFT_1629549 [Scenedesmus sp. NREL 46B-D3]|nr:hypothetical protein COO60DRAFT_1629549 [Scenedesmus sp. NREL 46B-D3]